ncbi:MAG: lipocalin family protein [Winogradskyella sp.]|uniref:lipocalin family protein n=1 Tax=Winogradskyella sp. TaxID=1883156 RepID=UPI0025D8A176|nr:lipocalin family protein [Winogradskyella sp.]NRB58495.1 lipocalin family protein [Winogradskyella sp.]
MKTNKLLAILCLSLFLFNFTCSDDDNDDDQTTANEENIIGTWQFQSSTTNGVIDTDNDPCLSQLTITFSATKVTTNDVYGENCEMMETYVNGYSINGNILTVIDEGEAYDSEILTLNDTSFTIEDFDEGDVYTETYIRL